MAIDTRDKRASAIHMMMPWRSELPEPSGTIGAVARVIMALLYSGFAGGGGGGGSGGSWLILMRRRWRR